MKLAIVTWGDAWRRATWTRKSTCKEAAYAEPVVSVGWLASRDKRGVLLVGAISGDSVGSEQFIPCRMVKSVRILPSKYDAEIDG